MVGLMYLVLVVAMLSFLWDAYREHMAVVRLRREILEEWRKMYKD